MRVFFLFFTSIFAMLVTSSDCDNLLTLFLSGDVMTGRGIDQALPYPTDPALHEPYVKSAKEYLSLARSASGPFTNPVNFSYVWGDALEEWQRRSPDLRIINLETSITTSNEFWKGKGVHYRMHPKNASVLAAAKIDFCSLANNHTLDWSNTGLLETLETLKKWNIRTAGAGRNLGEASAPALFEIRGKRVALFSYGSESSGIPIAWAAGDARAGINLLKDLSEKTVELIRQKIQETTQPKDFVVVSIHWGENWGYEIPSSHIQFAHGLIDRAGVDLIHGHSSHHPKGIEVYRNKLVLYGCGDFVNDYEGIEGYEEFRGDLSLMYFASLDPSTGNLIRLEMVPTQMRRFRVRIASDSHATWLKDTLNREGRRFGTRVEITKEDQSLFLLWK
jgi:poly-gamma-glutamate capsule biosynthesis protein CapA/YwtB (metallophosphatase superfamily)